MLDVDGVLVNGRPADGLFWATDIGSDLGISRDALHAVLFEPHWNEIVTGRKQLWSVIETALAGLAPSLKPQDFIDYWFAMDARLDEAALADCSDLRRRGIRIVLATNQDHLRAAHLMNDLGLRHHVDGIVYSAQIGARKPERAFFEAAACQSGHRPESLVLVDDTRANVEAALEAGWGAVLWTREKRLRDLV
ncbi:HAD family hydrolase [Consotaella aegiceratis]|uniref:HAD family hydrolase n=1 Tax=Consotaella aegiceratis TaxID=3097961 RepID=UPI002F41F111